MVSEDANLNNFAILVAHVSFWFWLAWLACVGVLYCTSNNLDFTTYDVYPVCLDVRTHRQHKC